MFRVFGCAHQNQLGDLFVKFVDFRRANDPRLLFVDLPGGFASPKNTQKKLAKFFLIFFAVSKKFHFVSNFFYFFLLGPFLDASFIP